MLSVPIIFKSPTLPITIKVTVMKNNIFELDLLAIKYATNKNRDDLWVSSAANTKRNPKKYFLLEKKIKLQTEIDKAIPCLNTLPYMNNVLEIDNKQRNHKTVINTLNSLSQISEITNFLKNRYNKNKFMLVNAKR